MSCRKCKTVNRLTDVCLTMDINSVESKSKMYRLTSRLVTYCHKAKFSNHITAWAENSKNTQY